MSKENQIPSSDIMEVSEYKCDEASIRKSSPMSDLFGHGRPEFWYMMRPSISMSGHKGWSHRRVSSLLDSYRMTIYWNGAEWAEFYPKQFNSPEEAWEEYWLKAKPAYEATRQVD